MRSDSLILTASDGDVTATVVLDGAMNYALAHNGISPLQRVVIDNESHERLTHLTLEISLNGGNAKRIAEPLRTRLPEIRLGERLELSGEGVRWPFETSTFAELDEAVTASIDVHVFDRTRSLRAQGSMRLLARDEWWALAIEESLAAFVTPRARAVQDLVSDASDLLGERTGDPSMQGYQGGAERAMKIAGALYDAMRARQIRYINPPASFEGTGQKIRSAHEVLVDRWGTCLDLAVAHAAVLEHAGLHPVLVLCDGHAFSGHLLEEQQLPELVLRDPRMILNYVETGLFIPVETTSLCAGENSKSFGEAVHATRQAGRWTHAIGTVRCLIDVAAAHRAVRPMPAVSVDQGVRIVEVAPRSAPAVPSIPTSTTREETQSTRARGAVRPDQAFPPRIEQWRNALLDLSFRNPLLNMRTGRTSLDLHVPHGALGLLEDLLYDGHALTLRPHDQLADIHRARGARTAQDIDAETLEAILRHERALYGACTEASYTTRMRGIQRRARTVFEETGANNLFVTLGTLEWEDSKRPARAPLFLVPVTLRAQRGRAYSLQIDDGAYAQPNQCLLEKLRLAHGLSIPEFRDPEVDASGIDLAGSLQAIRRALIDANLAFTVEESAHLSLLQFSTLQLWQDLSDNWSTLLRNPVVRHLVETPTDSFSDSAPSAELPADPEANAFCPIPIDGAQLQAVSWAAAGRSFVIEGPPGTGKSQTITNLIANAVATGKTILFVAEKQAALDVVRRRLDDVGLGDLCLDLHGKDQTPENVRKQLRAALHLNTSSNPESWSAVRARNGSAVETLRRYPQALHEVGGAGLSAWTARQSLLTSGDGLVAEVPRAVVSRVLDTDALYRTARELTQAVYDLGGAIDAHPWRLAELSDLEGSDRRSDVNAAVGTLASAVGQLEDGVIGELLRRCTDDGFRIVDDWLAACEGDPSLDAGTVEIATGPEWRTHVTSAHSALTTLRSDAKSLLGTFLPAVIDMDLDALLLRARTADSKLFKGKPRKAVIGELADVLRQGAVLEPAALTPTLEALISLRASARDTIALLRAPAGVVLPADLNPLDDAAERVLSDQVAALEASIRLVHVFPDAADVLRRADASSLSADARDTFARVRDSWNTLLSVVRSSPAAVGAWKGSDRSLLTAIEQTLPTWTTDAAGGLVQLGRWSQVYRRLAVFTELGLTEFSAQVSRGAVHPDEIEPVLRRSIASAALEERLAAPALAGFDGVARDRSIERFAEDAAEMRHDMVAELPATIVSARTFSPDHLVGKVGQLSRELTRKRGGMKIRELLGAYGTIISQLTPCLMMSPHSVARFLPAGALDIDLVVFDEASQVRVAEAISAMGRGKATVVVGDSQQMPPSALGAAETAATDDESAPIGIPADMESVLSEAVESNLPRLWLSWHYRSKHESLISFSNHKYYEGRLASFPRPPQDHPRFGVRWHRVDGSFERGGARVNRVEAETIVGEIRSRLAEAPNASIGVVTFNTQQRDLILDMLEECGDPVVAASLAADADSLFVKNLENVQGDERDVILFSLAFSPNPDTGKLPLNFGPLIQAGGERRLNVAVTRARAQVILFSSFDPSHIDLARSSSVGLAHLRSYMEIAQRAAADTQVLRPVTARDHHHDEVIAALRSAGLVVRKDVGLSDFTVDIGVAATEDGRWVAVFLDGEQYARRVTVGDREVLPRGVLVGAMGWASVERVWLPDWIRDPDEVVARIVRAAHDAPVAAEVQTPNHSAASHDVRVRRDAAEAGGDDHPPVGAVSSLGTPAPASIASTPIPLRGAPGGAPPSSVASPHTRFTPAEDRMIGVRDDLDALEWDREAREVVTREALDVIAAEGPVEATRLARLVCRRFGLQRVAAKRVASVLALVPRVQIDRSRFGDFVWPAGVAASDHTEFRVAEPGAARVIEEIAPHEVLNAMGFLIRTGAGISRDELVRESAALFGVRRLTTNLRSRLEAILDHGIAGGRWREDGDLIHE